jgi:hypothetical protein
MTKDELKAKARRWFAGEGGRGNPGEVDSLLDLLTSVAASARAEALSEAIAELDALLSDARRHAAQAGIGAERIRALAAVDGVRSP